MSDTSYEAQKIHELRRIANVLEALFDKERGCLKMVDIERGKVYATHLGRKLSEEPEPKP